MAAEPPAPHPAAGEAPPPDAREPDAVLSRRAQLLATEHWGLLAARSTAQSEVLTRITIFLLLVFYLSTGVISHYLTDHLDRGVLLEFALVTVAGLAIVIGGRILA